MGYVKIKFPCGLEIETQSFYHYWGDEDYDGLYDRGCPIHGKKCKLKWNSK